MAIHHLSRVAKRPPVKQLSPFMRTPSPEQVAFARTLRRLRRARDMTQEQLADRAGITAKHVGEIERATKEPGLTTAMSLAGALDLRSAELFAFVDEHLFVT